MTYITQRPDPKLGEPSTQTASPECVHSGMDMDADTGARARAGTEGCGGMLSAQKLLPIAFIVSQNVVSSWAVDVWSCQ